MLFRSLIWALGHYRPTQFLKEFFGDWEQVQGTNGINVDLNQ